MSTERPPRSEGRCLVVPYIGVSGEDGAVRIGRLTPVDAGVVTPTAVTIQLPPGYAVPGHTCALIGAGGLVFMDRDTEVVESILAACPSLPRRFPAQCSLKQNGPLGPHPQRCVEVAEHVHRDARGPVLRAAGGHHASHPGRQHGGMLLAVLLPPREDRGCNGQRTSRIASAWNATPSAKTGTSGRPDARVTEGGPVPRRVLCVLAVGHIPTMHGGPLGLHILMESMQFTPKTVVSKEVAELEELPVPCEPIAGASVTTKKERVPPGRSGCYGWG